jgi:lipoate-protein ligase A
MNMALDEAIFNSVCREKSNTCIRFYSWNPNAITIGHFQSMNNEIDMAECVKKNRRRGSIS